MVSANFLLIILFISFAAGHYHPAYFHSDDDDFQYKKVFTHFSDKLKLKDLVVMGTHDSAASAAYGNFDPHVKTQAISIAKQLKVGIRWLDIRVRRTNNRFALHHGAFFLNKMFGDVIQNLIDFLRENPDEFVFLSLREDHYAESSDQSNCEILQMYTSVLRKVFYKFNLNDEISKYRGGVLLFDKSGFDCIDAYENQCFKQDFWKLSTNWDLYKKWKEVKQFHEIDTLKCQLNYLNGNSGGVFPYFVASGHSFPGTYMPRLSTGLINLFFPNTYPDFPRVDFIGTIAFEGINVLFYELIKNKRIRKYSLYVVLADFPGQALIDAVNMSNRQMNYVNYNLLWLFPNLIKLTTYL